MLRIGTLLIACLLVSSLVPLRGHAADAVGDCASNNHETAIRACTWLIRKNPRNSVYYYNRAISYRETGRADQAMADYTKAIELNPRYYEAWNNRGTIFISRGDNQSALEDFTRSTQINPSYAIAHNNRGEALENMGRLQEAGSAYSRAIQLNPRYARAYANRGDINRKTGRREESIADYRRALALDESNRLALNGLKILGVSTNASIGPGPGDGPGPGSPSPSQSRPSPGPIQTARPAPEATPAPPQQRGTSTGTGFFVSAQGHVLTNYHVVENCTTFSVSHEGSLSQSARVVSHDSKNDLALLRTTGLTPGAVPKLRHGVRLGENIYIYGFPLTGMLASSGNFTIGNVTAVAGLGDDTTMIQMSAPVQPGNSGGPVLDQYGNVVAVVVSKLNALRVAKLTNDVPQNVNFAIKSLIAMSFLETANVNASAGNSGPEHFDATQIAERARAFTVQVRCQ